jgi:hypothetical protein
VATRRAAGDSLVGVARQVLGAGHQWHNGDLNACMALAVRANKADVVRTLVDAGADAEFVCTRPTAFSYALRLGNVRSAAALFRAGAQPDADWLNDEQVLDEAVAARPGRRHCASCSTWTSEPTRTSSWMRKGAPAGIAAAADPRRRDLPEPERVGRGRGCPSRLSRTVGLRAQSPSKECRCLNFADERDEEVQKFWDLPARSRESRAL